MHQRLPDVVRTCIHVDVAGERLGKTTLADPFDERNQRILVERIGVIHPPLQLLAGAVADAQFFFDHLLHALGKAARSEEHTSELQSLMRISYAVFCLKTKNTIKN